ncbi:MAG: GNAT family N-acetyltransferase [Bacteroidota bacterium]
MTIKTFEELSTTELYQIINLRERVFVVEQKCYYLDADNNDQKAWHLLLFEGKNLAAYLRILPPNVTYEYPSIGRVVVDVKYRSLNLGRKIMEEAINFLKEKYPKQPIKIGAQVYLNKFYQSLGFINNSEEYLEDGIPHVDMILI